MSRLDKLFGQTASGRAGIGADAELVSLLNRIVADIDRLKRGAYQGPGASFTGPLIIDNYKIEFLAGSLVATNLTTGSVASFAGGTPYQRIVAIGDEFIGFPPNTASWGSSSYGAAGNRWIDMVFATYKATTLVEGAVLGATATTLVSTPRAISQTSNLAIFCVGAWDMRNNPATIPGGSTLTYQQIYREKLLTLFDAYRADRQLMVFPWGWVSGVTQYTSDYAITARAAAAESAVEFIDLSQLTVPTAYVASPSSTTNCAPSLNGAQVIFSLVQSVLDA